MRKLALASLAVLVAASCGDNNAGRPDAPRPPDGPPIVDPDAPDVDGELPEGIAEVKAAAPGTGLTLQVNFVVVTYLKPQIGSPMNDPAGFTVQRKKGGLGLFVAVDPATTTPPLAVGDVISFTVTDRIDTGGQKRANGITNLVRHTQNFDVPSLSTDVSAATDLISAIDTYDSILVNLTGTIFENFAGSGNQFLRAGVTTAGIANDPNLVVRAPIALVDAIDMVNTCGVQLSNVPVGRFGAQTQIAAFAATDVVLTGCPAPTIVSALALTQTSVRFTFSRNIKANTVNANGSDFTFDNGLTATAATVTGKNVDVTTSAQVTGTTYNATVALTLTDLQNTPLAAGNQAFAGFVVQAIVKINEVNANITGGCDMIELRVIEGGSMANYTLKERLGLAGQNELSFTFPAGFIAQKNDFVIVHTNSASATCNAAGATQELTTKTDQARATFGTNFDTAFDFWSNDTGLTATDNVFTLFDAAGAIHDAVFISDDPAGPTAATNTEAAAVLVGNANQWDPALADYTDTIFRTNAADDLNATGTNQAGNTIQRVNDADTNAKADWTTGAGAAPTWGALNPGQAAL